MQHQIAGHSRARLAMRGVGASDRGHHRHRNEDHFGLFESAGLACIADGMGGLSAGDVASRIAVDSVARAARDARAGIEPTFLFGKILDDARDRMFEYQLEDPEAIGMGTTLTVAWLHPDGRLHLAHLGDSRAYLFRRHTLTPITRDHSLVGELVERGELTREEARLHPENGVITRGLSGYGYPSEPDLCSLLVHAGDRLILCTDGLTDMVPEDWIEELCRETSTREGLAESLIAEALEAGGYDNVTVVVVDVVEEGSEQLPHPGIPA